MFGVRTSTLAEWVSKGRLAAQVTPGGHRRFRRGEVIRLLNECGRPPEADQRTMDAVRMYEQGWNIAQVADRFGVSYGVMRRLLMKHTTIRTRGGKWPPNTPQIGRTDQ